MSQMETGNVHARHKEAMAGSGAIPPPIDTDVPSPAAPGNEEREDNLQRKRMQRVLSDGSDAPAVEKQGHELLAMHREPLDRSSAASKKGRSSKGKPTKRDKNLTLSDAELSEFMLAFQTGLQMQLRDEYAEFQEEEKDGESPDPHERATQLLFRLFKTFSLSNAEDADDKHANSMDVSEYLRACEVLCICPGPLQKKDAINLFKDVNRGSTVSDFDTHEMNKFEFVKAIDLIAKRVGAGTIEDLCFGVNGDGSNMAAERERRRQEAAAATEKTLSNIQDLADLDVKMMKEILKIFQARSSDNSAEPELDMDTFVDVFVPILNVADHEAQMLFMKIDVNSDGMVSWNEFSSFVLDQQAKEEAATAADSILENRPPLHEPDPASHHEDAITCMELLPRLVPPLIVTASDDGYLRLWVASTGSSSAGRNCRAVPPGKTIISLSVLPQSSMIAVGGDDFKIRFFEPRTLVHELTFDCEGQWPFSMSAFLFPDDHDSHSDAINQASKFNHDDPLLAQSKKGFSGWFVWGDGEGTIHLMPEKQLLTFRTQHEVVPFFRAGVKGTWDVKCFRGLSQGTGTWITTLMFLPDIGIAGIIIAAGSNGHICVVSFEQRRIFHFYNQHRLSVKTLAWCGRQNNMLASAGLDREIHLWRPVAIRHGKPTLAGALPGHGAGVVKMVFHEQRDVLLSLDSTCVTLMWDLSSKTLLSRMNPLSQNPFDISARVNLIMVNQRTRHLITATNHLKHWAVRMLDLGAGVHQLIQHTSEVMIMLYNDTFDLVLTGDRNGLVSLWSGKSGEQIFKFYCEEVPETYGLPAMSTAAFDISKRRLIIGWNQGSVQVYNFSNGTILRTLATDSTMRVTAVGQYEFERSNEMYQFFTASFEDGLLLQWADDKPPRDEPVRRMEVPDWMGVEFAEVGVNAMALGTVAKDSTKSKDQRSVLVTVRNDGVAFFWDIITGFMLRPHVKKTRKKKDYIPEEKDRIPRSLSDESVPSRSLSAVSMQSASTLAGPQAGPQVAATKESLCLQVSDTAKTSLTCINILHRSQHISFIADSLGLIRILNLQTGQMLGQIQSMAGGLSSKYLDDVSFNPRINCMAIDFTDSFLFVGDAMGELQVWDISQVFDDSYEADLSLVIDVFRWKAHETAVTQIRHLGKHNVIITSGSEEHGVCVMWTVFGQKIGLFGHNRWTPDVISKKIDLGIVREEEENAGINLEEDEPKKPLHERVMESAYANLALVGQKEKVEIIALKGMLQRDRRERGLTASVFKSQGEFSWEPPSAAVTPDMDKKPDPDDQRLRGELRITIETLQHLPSMDKYSKADPYTKILLGGTSENPAGGDFPERRTRVFLNQNNCQVNEAFLFYVESLELRLFLQVWDDDPGGDENHDLIGQIDTTVLALLSKGNTATCRMPLLRPDGSGAGKLGSVAFKVEFEPIESALIGAVPYTLQDHIRAALKGGGVVPIPPLKFISHHDPESSRDKAVTSLATARLQTLDFRNLSVYHMQPNLKLSSLKGGWPDEVRGAMTERHTDRTRGPRASRRTHSIGDSPMGETSSHMHNGTNAPVSHRFSKESAAGQLERGLDLAVAEMYSSLQRSTTGSSSLGNRRTSVKKQPMLKKADQICAHHDAKQGDNGIVHVFGVQRKLDLEQQSREAIKVKQARRNSSRRNSPLESGSNSPVLGHKQKPLGLPSEESFLPPISERRK